MQSEAWHLRPMAEEKKRVNPRYARMLRCALNDTTLMWIDIRLEVVRTLKNPDQLASPGLE